MHPQSIVHGLVEFRDGSVIAQLGAPDMRIPIAHCLAWPGAHRRAGAAARSRPSRRRLTFEEPDLARFPALALARARARGGRAAQRRCSMPPTRSRSPNFWPDQLDLPEFRRWSRRPWMRLSRRGLTREPASVEDALAIDHNARLLARDLLPEIAAKAF